MSLPQSTRLQLVNEGLEHVHEILEFDGEFIKGIADNLRQPGGRIPNSDLNAATRYMILAPHFSFGEKGQMRLKVELMILCYNETVGKDITAPKMRWTTTITAFVDHWKDFE